MTGKIITSLFAGLVLECTALDQPPEMKEPALFFPGLPLSESLSRPEPGRPFTGLFRVKAGKMLLLLHWADGNTDQITLYGADQETTRVIPDKNRKNAARPQKLRSRNAILKLEGIPVKEIFVRPNLQRYADDRIMNIIVNNKQDVREKIVRIRIEKTDDGAAFYVDGSYAGTIHRKGKLLDLEVLPRPGMQYCDISKEDAPGARFHVIDFASKEYRDVPAELKFTKELPVPMEFSNTGRDLRKLRATSLKIGYMGDQDRARTAFDAMPESLHWSVPARQYTNAWILCAPIPDDVSKPDFKVLMTRWTPQGRGDAISTVTVAPRDKEPGAEQVGSAVLETDGRKQEVPLYLVKAPIHHGKIQDLIYTDRHAALPFHDYLDFEIQGPNRYVKPGRNELSSAVVFGVTLEKSPLSVQFTQKLPGSVFEPGEKTELPVRIKADKAGKYTLNYTVRDVDGKAVENGSKSFMLKENEETSFDVVPEVRERGWYGIDFTVADEKGTVFSDYHSTFVLLQENTRQAGYDSPYSCWWNCGAHFTVKDPDVMGPLLYRLGTLKTNLNNISEKDMEKWKITLGQIPFPRYIYDAGLAYAAAKKAGDFSRLDQVLKDHVARMYKKYPHAGGLLVFHESFFYPMPPPILEGKKMPELKGKELERAPRLWDGAMQTCTVMRKYFPDKKIVFGNTVSLPGLIQSFAEKGFPLDKLVDEYGIETPGQGMPENLNFGNGAGGLWLVRETARLMGVSKPLTCTYEWTVRRRGASGGPKGQAEWIVRDILVAHAYGCSLIPVSGIQEAGTTYFYDPNYGEFELCSRELHPYPAYAAAAVATRILDRVQFRRLIPAGNGSVYLAEFTRADGKNVYALWMTKGVAECELEVKGEGTVVTEDLYGRRGEASVSGNTLKTQAASAVTWFVTDRNIVSAKTLSASIPLPDGVKPEKICSLTTDDLESLGSHKGINEFYTAKDDILHPVPVSFENVSDPDAGPAVEFTFDLSPLKDKLFNRGGYAAFKLKKEIPVDDRFEAIGIRAKGNGTKGRIIYIIRDANGQEFISFGEPWNGGSVLNDLYEDFSFEGWNLLSMALSEKYARPASWFGMQWYGCPVRANTMKRPYVLTGFILTTFPKKERLDGYSDAVPKVRLSDIVFYE